MKEVKMFTMATCPHCKKALSLMEEICLEHPEYNTIKIEKIDVTKDADYDAYAAKFNFYYVPTFCVDGVKIHEGVPTKEALEKVCAEAVK